MSDESPTRDLAAVFHQCHDELIACWREQVRALPSARDLDHFELTDHIPDLVAEITRDLAPVRDGAGDDEKGMSPRHGVQRFHDGFDLREVVAEYHSRATRPGPSIAASTRPSGWRSRPLRSGRRSSARSSRRSISPSSRTICARRSMRSAW
jgi:hypothetical protein